MYARLLASTVDQDPSWWWIFQSSLASCGSYAEVTEATGGGGKVAAIPGTMLKVSGRVLMPQIQSSHRMTLFPQYMEQLGLDHCAPQASLHSASRTHACQQNQPLTMHSTKVVCNGNTLY